LPGQNTMGFNQTGIGSLPLETCETMNGSWGFNIKDTKFKSTRQLIHMLVRAAGQNSNLLLNTGPMPNGKIQPENVNTLKEMGMWMQKYGETIYDSRGGPAGSKTWGVTTAKDNKIFVHVLDAEDLVIYVPLNGKTVKKASAYDTGEKIPSCPSQNRSGQTGYDHCVGDLEQSPYPKSNVRSILNSPPSILRLRYLYSLDCGPSSLGYKSLVSGISQQTTSVQMPI
ncbi:alpha-L-fucosidase, partial [Bacteroidota bacterium]